MGSAPVGSPDLEGLIKQMTLEEKALLTAGANFWETNAIERLGIPRMKVSDGPNGARGENFENGVTSACFPASVSLAASFNEDLAGHIGKALGQETKTKGARVLLGPTVCPHRHPTGGRNFESFSEDPLLAGRLASKYIEGLQSEGIGATIKHYAVNEQESHRFTIDAHVSERALREIYLKPFEIAVKNAKPWSLMSSYNLVNGTHADSSKHLLIDVLRKQWGYKGHVMSDWGGTNSVHESLNAGHDLEMPGPAIHRKFEKIKKAIDEGKLTVETLDERVLANLRLLGQCGVFEDPVIPPEQAIDLPEHRALIRKAGAEGAVLLKNEKNILPLQKEKTRSIAMLGLAKQFLGHGGGSAAVNAHRKITAYDGFQEAVGDKIELKYAEGARTWRNLPPFSEGVANSNGKPGFTVNYFKNSNKPAYSKDFAAGAVKSFEDPEVTRVVMSGTYTPPTTGKHYISFSTIGNTKVYINDDLVFNYEGQSADVMALLLGVAKEDQKRYDFVQGQQYQIRVDASIVDDADSPLSFLSSNIIGFNFGFMRQELFEADLLTEATDVAKSADVAIVFVGNTPSWETEGSDRDDMNLPMNGSQDKLIAAVAAANPNTIVVNSTGSPISMPWVADVPAILQSWFPGQEAGHAIADVVFGAAYPGGKLPVTFPKKLSDAPASDNFPGDLKKNFVEYKEGIYIGYRHYDQKPDTVLFPFGFGLSYTTFEVSNASVSSASFSKDQTVSVTADVANTGAREGSEIIQVYVGPSQSQSIDRPIKELKGYAKAHLAAGSKTSVSVTLDKESFSYFNEAKNKWSVEAGKYTVSVGTSSTQIVSTLEVEVKESFDFDP
ncbi:glycoside hydrolase family 3 protein [Aaosphaeria arxii CBS 175.79]|uniref:beta-glucosidase n=1 Tax=Aaosphaeria arxii CBS 175.79 TaxID=1450172 RepID=A0A6A5XHZ6_9PLEO|nr:glycoside hydrolase family 3 protein [Aaosphaeria arxii CBS 175.79]KAF2011944.1 glycoside hydrolase family 3 protein [Aaosphaeria arxii CBS 175.79]